MAELQNYLRLPDHPNVLPLLGVCPLFCVEDVNGAVQSSNGLSRERPDMEAPLLRADMYDAVVEEKGSLNSPATGSSSNATAGSSRPEISLNSADEAAYGCCLVFPLATGGSLESLMTAHGPIGAHEVATPCLYRACGALLLPHMIRSLRSWALRLPLAWLTCTSTGSFIGELHGHNAPLNRNCHHRDLAARNVLVTDLTTST